MNEKITNELTEQGYSIVNDAFSSSEFENFRAIIKETPFRCFDIYKDTYQGIEIPNEELETVKAGLSGKIEKTVIEHTLKQFEKTAFFAENLNGYENNGWNDSNKSNQNTYVKKRIFDKIISFSRKP